MTTKLKDMSQAKQQMSEAKNKYKGWSHTAMVALVVVLEKENEAKDAEIQRSNVYEVAAVKKLNAARAEIARLKKAWRWEIESNIGAPNDN